MRRILLASLFLLPLALTVPALAGGRKPQAIVLEVRAYDGELVNVTLLVRDKESRPVDLRLEMKVKGVKGWQPATADRALTAVPSSPEGTQFAFRWLAHQDLGTSWRRKARLRVKVTNPKGKKKKSKKTELFLYRETDGGDLRDDLAADLEADGTLDGLVLIDTRRAADFRTGAIPGAVPILLEDIQERGEEALPFPRDARLVFYCYGGT